MSLRTRISEWRARIEEQNQVVSVSISVPPGRLEMNRREAQELGHILSHGKVSWGLSVFALLLMGAGAALMCVEMFNLSNASSLSINSHRAIFFGGAVFLAASLGVFEWLGHGFRYQRGVP